MRDNEHEFNIIEGNEVVAIPVNELKLDDTVVYKDSTDGISYGKVINITNSSGTYMIELHDQTFMQFMAPRIKICILN